MDQNGIRTVRIDSTMLKAEAVHYSSMPYSWLVSIVQEPAADVALTKWYRLLRAALMDEEAQKKLDQLTLMEFRDVLEEYLRNEPFSHEWDIPKD